MHLARSLLRSLASPRSDERAMGRRLSPRRLAPDLPLSLLLLTSPPSLPPPSPLHLAFDSQRPFHAMPTTAAPLTLGQPQEEVQQPVSSSSSTPPSPSSRRGVLGAARSVVSTVRPPLLLRLRACSGRLPRPPRNLRLTFSSNVPLSLSRRRSRWLRPPSPTRRRSRRRTTPRTRASTRSTRSSTRSRRTRSPRVRPSSSSSPSSSLRSLF